VTIRRYSPYFILLALLVGIFFGACSSLSPPVYYTDYRVRKGDTISRIAERYGSSVAEIVEANDIEDPRNLKIGRVLKVPLQSAGTKEGHGSDFGRPGKKINIGVTKKYIGNLFWPVDSKYITSPFGWRSSRFHDGVDIRSEYGVKIRAAHDGLVIFNGRGLSGYGNLIAIKGQDGILTMYGHNQRNYVKKGERVSRGDLIGEVGSSGRANGPHLHFEVRVMDSKGKYVAVNPLGFFK